MTDETAPGNTGCCGGGQNTANCGFDTQTGHREILSATSTLTFADRLDHFYARWGVDRMGHRVDPGLYRLGEPTPDSPVFVSANYTLSFDALRSALEGFDCYILVLDTKGINVWCAAGKGTFGTDELVKRIEYTGLTGIVRHRKLILPQLGAPGVSWPEVIRRSGFSVEYGPVRAEDLPEYLKTHTATPAMRRVRFPVRDRAVLIPVELVHVALPAIVVAIVLYFLAGPVSSLAAVTAVVAGTVLFPLLLPYIPTRDFSMKGFILGFVVSLPFAAWYAAGPGLPGWAGLLAAVTPLLLIPAVTAYLALNFTGSTPFTSRTGVKKEIFRYVKPMTGMAVAGVLFGILLGVSRLMGVI
ncbi:hypothetical protein J2741_001628 [Methanolinea mesophila]|uniref:mercury methylation corrinoid protein HgcA n=1 Tax=Methanolinea mesophila TaxID=547055 RepID=UPI001FD83D32|nr:mercury methylation corrinoid protein HgcA [Methanolinea mesophila]MBP1929081.1 hypothetical protein [Methanolinea mesophila]